MTGSARDVLAQKGFRLFLTARLLSSLAQQIATVAVGWLVYDVSGDPLQLGLVGLAQFVPALLLTLPGGHLADRADRRLILLCATLLTMLAMGGLLLLSLEGKPSLPAIFAVMAVLGAVRAFWAPAGQSMTAMLVERHLLSRAVALNSTIWQVTVIAGPAMGGLLYAFGPAVVFGSATLLLGSAAIAVFLLAPMPPHGLGERPHILDGIRFVRSRPEILGSISLDLFAVLLGGATALLPIYARDILMTGPLGLGLLRSAPAMGAALSAALLAHRPPERHAGHKLFIAVAVFGLGTIVFGLSTSFPLSMAALAILGAADMVSVVLRQTLVQINTPDDMRGRVSAVNLVFITASNELGEFESGVAAALLGTVPAVVVGGVGCLLVAGVWAWRFPALRNFELPRSHP
ncbi:MFS transporter [Paramagnetospirillum magneticum]|uniref:Permease of the major facilitator superfamily n=1 Tax=Paramagnetospirillum magneticum (strain ATCC 700264 / AMB-1) TaxID=342108 RepID=Q2VZ22_PARM1|nr:MFS transporter [Paramagnetospirillum magneticum]BAE53153.1 Permease of the major facilitator superfamily [Paramagnetospirillum magneticum AMB-1]